MVRHFFWLIGSEFRHTVNCNVITQLWGTVLRCYLPDRPRQGRVLRSLISCHILQAVFGATYPIATVGTALAISAALTGSAYAMTEVARFTGSSSTSTPAFPSFGDNTLTAGQQVQIIVSGAPGARIRFFVGSTVLYDNVIPASGMLDATFTLSTTVSGSTSIGIEDNVDGVTTTVTVIVTENTTTPTDPPPADPPPADPPPADPPADDPPPTDPPAEDPPAEDPPAEDPPAEDPPAEDPPAEDPPPPPPPPSADGQAASDQVRAVLDNIIPGLNGDLGDAFFIPDPTGLLPDPPIVPLAQVPADDPAPAVPVRNDQGQNQNQGQNDNAGSTASQCKEDELEELRAQLQRAKDRSERLNAQARTLDVTNASPDSLDFLLARAQDFVKAAKDGPVALNALDQLALQAAVNQLQSLDPSVVAAFEETNTALRIARGERANASADLNTARSRVDDLGARIETMRATREEILAGGDVVLRKSPQGPATSDPDEILDRIESLQLEQSREASGIPELREKAEKAESEFATAEQAHEQSRAKIEGLDSIEQTLSDALKRAAAAIIQPSFEAFEKIAELEQKIQDLEADCDEDDQNARLSPSSHTTPVKFAVNRLGKNDQLSFSISTRDLDTALDPSVNIFFGGNVTFHNDNRTGVGQDGETMSIAGGISWLVGQDTTIGLAGRYAHSDLNGASGSTKADTSSLAAFIQGRVTEKVFYQLVGAYTISDMSSVFVQPGITTTGNPEVDSIAVQGSLSGQLESGDVLIRPSVGLSYVHVDQASFVLSDGTLSPGQTTDRVSMSAGAQLSKQIRNEAHGTTTSPYAGLTAIANLSDTKSFLLPNGTTSSAGVFGATANLGVSVATDRGVSYSFGGSMTAFEQGQTTYGLNVSLTIPLN
jgi:outer membrane autotransporter protein